MKRNFRLRTLAFAVACGCMAWGKDFRPPAVPLVSVEPHFSIWSAADRLTDRETTHWAGALQPLSIRITADGVEYRLCGREPMDMSPLPQTSLKVRANETVYTFGDGCLSAEVSFLTPRLVDDLDVFSRPVTYVTVTVTGAKNHKVEMIMGHELVRNHDGAPVVERHETVCGLPALVKGKRDQTPFSIKGDRKRADWGYVWLVGPQVEGNETRFLLGYENVKSVRFFGKDLVDWWQRAGKTFLQMLTEAVRDYPALRTKTRAFDVSFAAKAEMVGGAKYRQIAELAWRQSFAACKFVASPEGEPYMFSAENGSGGMIGTTDVFYPQLPHLLLAGSAFVKATLAPTCVYAASDKWPYPYAPHDLGLFPVAEGQHYAMKKGQSVGGKDDDASRMPVEECGNMLICLGALAQREGHADFASCWWDEVTKWAQYLEKVGFDPENQLCTDDFAGHLAHNANLSVKTIVALACYAKMAGMRGDAATAARYRKIAKDMVPRWMAAADGGRHGSFRLAFDRPDSWSMKYNLVWDRILGLDLFPAEVATREMKAYHQLQLEYGLPLDGRKNYTKTDWLVWCGVLTGSKSDLETLVAPVYRFLDETPDRTAFTDFYEADCRLARLFTARSVVGGVYMPFLAFDASALSVVDSGRFSPEACDTESIQKRLDDCFRDGGGTVTLEKGVYRVGGLRVRSNTTLFLKSGAILRASRVVTDYDIMAADTLEPLDDEDKSRGEKWMPHAQTRGKRSETFSRAGSRWHNAIIRIYKAENVKIIAEKGAVIDGCNSYDSEGEEYYRGVHGISAHKSHNLECRGYTIQHTGNWAHNFKECRNLVFADLEILAGHDGVHISSCDNVRITDCVMKTGDDCVAGFDNQDVFVSGCTLNTACSAFRFGGTRFVAEKCRCYGPAAFLFRGSLSKEEKEKGLMASKTGRRNMLALFTYYADKSIDIREQPRDMVFRDIVVENADRFIHYNFSGNETWQLGMPLGSVHFERIRATGVKLPLCAYGEKEKPIALTFKDVSIRFAAVVPEFIRGAWIQEVSAEDLAVEGVEGPFYRNWSEMTPKFEFKGTVPANPKIETAKMPFEVQAI